MSALRLHRVGPPWYAAVLAAWRKRADVTSRDALWAAAAWAATADDVAREHPASPSAGHLLRSIEQNMLERLSEDPALGLLVINERIAMRERLEQAANAERAPDSRPDRGQPRSRERQWLIPR